LGRIQCFDAKFLGIGDNILNAWRWALVKGDELGFIKFGSRVDLLLPVDTKLDVKIGQKVVGKKTVIGKLT